MDGKCFDCPDYSKPIGDRCVYPRCGTLQTVTIGGDCSTMMLCNNRQIRLYDESCSDCPDYSMP